MPPQPEPFILRPIGVIHTPHKQPVVDGEVKIAVEVPAAEKIENLLK
ncbi:MAG: hypothetical protein ACLFVU_03610 [Phycisphaerae bacterium]